MIIFLKQKLKKILFRIPLGIIIFQSISYIYNIPNKFREIKVYRRIFLRNEARKILKKLMKNKKKKVLLVFDCKVSPGTLGDFIYFIMLGRFFLSMKLKITLILIIGEYRVSWNRHRNQSGINKHLRIINRIALVLLDKNTNIKTMTYTKFRRENYLNNKDYFVLFPKRVEKRIQIYRESFGLLNYLFYFSNKKKVTDTLLHKNFLAPHANCKKLPKKYITVHCRNEKKKNT